MTDSDPNSRPRPPWEEPDVGAHIPRTDAQGFDNSRAAQQVSRTRAKQDKRAAKKAAKAERGPRNPVVTYLIKGMGYIGAGAVVAVGLMGGAAMLKGQLESPRKHMDKGNPGGLKESGRDAIAEKAPSDFGPHLYEKAPVPDNAPDIAEYLFAQRMQYFTGGYGIQMSEWQDEPNRALNLIAAWLAEDPEKQAAFERQFGGPLSEAGLPLQSETQLQQVMKGAMLDAAAALALAEQAAGGAPMREDALDALCAGEKRDQGLDVLTGKQRAFADEALQYVNGIREVLELDRIEMDQFVGDCKKLVGKGGGRSLDEIERDAEQWRQEQIEGPATTTTTEARIEGAAYDGKRDWEQHPEAVLAAARAAGAPADLTPQQAALWTLMKEAAGPEPLTRSPQQAVAYVHRDGSVDVRGIS